MSDAPRHVRYGVLAGTLAIATVACLWAGYLLAAIVGAAIVAGLRAAITHTQGDAQVSEKIEHAEDMQGYEDAPWTI